MSKRTIIGRLDADPETGNHERVHLRVVENTGDHLPTTHFIEAKLALGSNVAASLRAQDAVIVVGHEHTVDWKDAEGVRWHGRVIEAEHIGPDLSRAPAPFVREAPAR